MLIVSVAISETSLTLTGSKFLSYKTLELAVRRTEELELKGISRWKVWKARGIADRLAQWYNTGLACGMSGVRTPAEPTIRVLK